MNLPANIILTINKLMAYCKPALTHYNFVAKGMLVFILLLAGTKCSAQYHPVRRDDVFAYADSSGKPVTGYIYTEAHSFKNGIAFCSMKVKREDDGNYFTTRWGAIDSHAKPLIPFKFDKTEMVGNLIAGYTLKIGFYNYTLYNTDGSLFYDCTHCRAANILNSDLFYITVDTAQKPNSPRSLPTSGSQVTGVYKYNGQKLFSARGVEASRLVNGITGKDYLSRYVLVESLFPTSNSFYQDRRMSVYDLSGNLIVDTAVTTVSLYYYNKYIAINYTNAAQLVDTFFNTVLPFSNEYQNLYFFPTLKSDSILGFRKDNKYGIMRLNGQVIVPATYDKPLTASFAMGVKAFRTQADGKEMQVNLANDTIINAGEYASHVSTNKPFIVDRGGDHHPQYGVKNITGATLVPFIYDRLYEIDSNTYAFFAGDSAGFVNLQGKELIRVKGAAITPLAEGVFAVRPVMPNPFINDTVTAKLPEAQSRLMRINGSIIPVDTFDYAAPCQSGCISLAHTGGNTGKSNFWDINKQGKPFCNKPGYRVCSYFVNGVAVVADANTRKYGLVNTQGKVIVNAVYSKIETKHDGTFLAGWCWPARSLKFTNDDKIIPVIKDGKFFVQKDNNTEWIEMKLPK